jgi:hypothetical protein
MTRSMLEQWGQVAYPEIDYDYGVLGAPDLEAGKLAARHLLSIHGPVNVVGATLLSIAMWSGPVRLSSAVWSAVFVVLKVGWLLFLHSAVSAPYCLLHSTPP